MNFHRSKAPKRGAKESAEVTAQAGVKHPAKVRRVRSLVPAAASVRNRKFNDGDTVDFDALKAAGVVKNGFDGIKVLGNGKIEKKLTVKVTAFSESAKAAIEAAGGKAEVI